MAQDLVRDYYAQFGEREWLRLTRPLDGLIEWTVNCRLLAAHLPPAGHILDLGGGAGRYTIWLAEQGYTVTLADLSPELLTIARDQIARAGVGQQVMGIVETDACNLAQWADESFDAVLCLGPFYHLPDLQDRRRAAGELARVLRVDGITAIAFMPRLALLRRTLAISSERSHITNSAFLAGVMKDGAFFNTIPGRFTAGYGAKPEEIAPFLADFGLQMITLASSQGISMGIEEAFQAMQTTNPSLW